MFFPFVRAHLDHEEYLEDPPDDWLEDPDLEDLPEEDYYDWETV
jgi:hypothetical protein